MTYFSNKLIAAATATLSLVATQSAFAVDFPLTIGVGQELTLTTSDRILVDLGANRSYTCEAVPTTATTDFDFDTTVTQVDDDDDDDDSVTGRAGGTIVPGIGGELGGRDDNRIIVTPTDSGRYAFSVASVAGASEMVNVRCFATTVFGGFNTFVNDFNFLELQNIGNAPITAKVTAVTFSGDTVIDNQTVSIPAGRRVDVSIHDAAGSDVFGSLIVTHNGPVGNATGAKLSVFRDCGQL